MNAHEVLVAARDRIDQVGWWQDGGPNIGTEGTCAANALFHFGKGVFCAHYALAEAIGLDVRFLVTAAIFDWNDTPGRTKAEVLAAFDKAIAATAPPPPDVPLSVPVEELAA